MRLLKIRMLKLFVGLAITSFGTVYICNSLNGCDFSQNIVKAMESVENTGKPYEDKKIDAYKFIKHKVDEPDEFLSGLKEEYFETYEAFLDACLAICGEVRYVSDLLCKSVKFRNKVDLDEILDRFIGKDDESSRSAVKEVPKDIVSIIKEIEKKEGIIFGLYRDMVENRFNVGNLGGSSYVENIENMNNLDKKIKGEIDELNKIYEKIPEYLRGIFILRYSVMCSSLLLEKNVYGKMRFVSYYENFCKNIIKSSPEVVAKSDSLCFEGFMLVSCLGFILKELGTSMQRLECFTTGNKPSDNYIIRSVRTAKGYINSWIKTIERMRIALHGILGKDFIDKVKNIINKELAQSNKTLSSESLNERLNFNEFLQNFNMSLINIFSKFKII